MEKCGDCIFFLPHKGDGFNCGFLIKKVDKNNRCCDHFQSPNKNKPPLAIRQ
ncbi:MAG: hypothetical protein H6Q93_1594 [Nitrospirae bacterium]|jgi:hypothetical protein|nr:hypothetical protein [Nitrospirota bacterium]